MKPYRVIIIDDEQSCRDALATIITRDFASEMELIAVCKSPVEGLEIIGKAAPDVVFLDVEMQPFTGFEMLNRLDEINFEIFFTTAYDKYAVGAIKASALDFILKPVGTDSVREALQRLKEKRSRDKTMLQLQTLIGNIRNPETERKLALPTMTGLEFIQLADVIRLESEGNYTTFYLKDKRQFLVSKPLKEYEEMLSQSNFFRVHQSHLINLRFIKRYIKGEGGLAEMEDGSSIEVSRRRKEEFLKLLREFS